MRAAVYTEYGSPDVLSLREVEKPIPKDDEVLIRVHATTVTAGDARMRAFRVPASYWLPARLTLGVFSPRRRILGMEFAGKVEAVGQHVTRFEPGEAVFGATDLHLGAHAEYCCLPETGIMALKPSNVSYEQAAPLAVGGRTALHFLRQAQLKPGDKILIYGASGSVGTFAIQLAKHFGAMVTAVCSGPNQKLVESLGADHSIDYTTTDFAELQQAYDVVFDTVGLAPYAACMRALKNDGVYLQAAASAATWLRMAWTALTSRKRVVAGGPDANSVDLHLLGELAMEGKLVPTIDQTFLLEQIAEAHSHVDTGRKRGNVVIRPLRALIHEAQAA